MDRRRTTIALAAAAALSLSQPACTAPAPARATPPADGVLGGTREVAISMESGPPAMLRVDAKGNLVGHARITDRSVFVLTPAGDRHRIRTAWTSACMGVRRNATGPATVVAATCNPDARGQLFTVTRTGATDSQGRPTHRIGTDAGTLTFSSRDGLHIEPRDDVDVTGFALLDQGPVRPR